MVQLLASAGTDDGSCVGRDEVTDFAWMPSVRHMDAGLPKTKTVLEVRYAHSFKDIYDTLEVQTRVPDADTFNPELRCRLKLPATCTIS